MLGSIKHGLTNLFNFNGRDARQTFWYYVLFVYLGTTLLMVLAMIPGIIDMFGRIIDLAKVNADPKAVDQAMGVAMGEMMGSVRWIGMGTGIAFIVLLAASLVRRLHDSGKPGWWALGPGVLQAIGIALMPLQMKAMAAAMSNPAALNDPTAMYRAQGWNGLVGWAAIGLVVWFGVRKSTEGPNEYGDAPVSF